MLRWSLIGTALCVWLVVLGCVILPQGSTGVNAAPAGTVAAAPAPPPATIQTREGLPYCGVAIQIQRTDWIDKYKQCIDEAANLGADTIELVVDTRQESVKSTRIFLDVRMTPTPDQLISLIRHAKSKKLRVIFMPMVLLDNPRDDDWRGKFSPQEEYGGWEEWFDSYRKMLFHFAWIAEANDVDVFVIGSELISAEKHVDEWIKTIESVRKVFHRRITYSSNWDHYRQVEFWNHLDLIGLNSYWSFGTEGSNEDPTSAQIQQRWKEIQSDLIPWSQKQGKPLLFIEAGWYSQTNVAYQPWDYTQDQPIALELQRKLYEGFFQAWWGNPNLAGFNIWDWPPVEGGPTDKGYTPKNKPAEKVAREWLAKPRWDVK